MIQTAESQGHKIGKVVVLASLLGLACITFWALSQGAAAEESATSMAIAPMQPMQATRAQSFMRPPQAVPRSNDIARISNAQSEESMTKRQMMAGLAASAGAALPLAANAGVELKDDGRTNDKAATIRKFAALPLAANAGVELKDDGVRCKW